MTPYRWLDMEQINNNSLTNTFYLIFTFQPRYHSSVTNNIGPPDNFDGSA